MGGRAMMKVSALAVFVAATSSFSGNMANAGACDYRPSHLIGGSGAGVVATTGLGIAAAGIALPKAQDFTLSLMPLRVRPCLVRPPGDLPQRVRLA